MRAFRFALAFVLSTLACIGHAAYQGPFNGTFQTIADPYCYNTTFYNGFTVGGQYLDPNNGVIYGMHSMLARWQGPNFVSNNVFYDMGNFDGAHLVNQRGYQPEDATLGSGGVSVACYDLGMLINTRFNPHRPIVGGGYNDMYGFAWAPGSRPRPFTQNGLPTHLVLQGNVGVASWLPSNGADASAAACFFAYLSDTTQTNLHPIAILACTHLDGTVDILSSTPSPGFDYPDGVWFGSGIISNDPNNHRPFVSTYYTAGNTVGMSPFGPISSPDMPFFRAHIRPEDWTDLVNSINATTCSSACPARGYSTNPADYELEYAGLIMESGIRNDIFDVSDTDWIPNDPAKPQVMLGLHGYAIGIYRGVPN